MSYETKDSGKRAEFAGGMVRDTNNGKVRFDLAFDGPMFLRWVALMTRGAIKYDARNWMLAQDRAAYDRYLESAARHFGIWFWWRTYGVNIEDPEHPSTDPPTEDHAAAIFFNVNGVEYVDPRLDRTKIDETAIATKWQHRYPTSRYRWHRQWHDCDKAPLRKGDIVDGPPCGWLGPGRYYNAYAKELFLDKTDDKNEFRLVGRRWPRVPQDE